MKANRNLIRQLTILFALFQKGTMPTDKLGTGIQRDDNDSAYNRIRCPICKWRPNAYSRWYCSGDEDSPPEYYAGCGTSWNTFDTHGVCPGCDHQWAWTDCLSCYGCSLHEDWYADEED